MNRLWRLLHHLFGDEPPPRPVGHGHHGEHRGHGEDDEEARRQAEEQVADAVDDSPPPAHHDH